MCVRGMCARRRGVRQIAPVGFFFSVTHTHAHTQAGLWVAGAHFFSSGIFFPVTHTHTQTQRYDASRVMGRWCSFFFQWDFFSP